MVCWLAVDKNGSEYIYDSKPFREEYIWATYGNSMKLPVGTIIKILGKELTWKDKPIKLE